MSASALRLLLALAYPWLAHAAHAASSPALAALALGDIALIVLLGPLLRWRAWAWALLAAIVAGLVRLGDTHYALLLLLAPPVLFIALAAWLFARSLRRDRTPLISAMVAAMYHRARRPVPDDLLDYSRNLTRLWAGLLGALAAVNLWLALCAVPGGVLAQLGHVPALAVSDTRASLFANLLNYGLVIGCFVGEYIWRQWRFRDPPYRGFFDFLRKLAQVGPEVWRRVG